MDEKDNSTTITLTEKDWEKIHSFSKTINIFDSNQALQYALNVQKKGTEMPAILLKQLKTDLSTSVNDIICKLLGELEALTPDEDLLKNPMQHPKELKKLRSEFYIIDSKITSLLSVLQEQELILRDNGSTLKNLYDNAVKVFRSIHMHIEAGKERIQYVEYLLKNSSTAKKELGIELTTPVEINNLIRNFKDRLESLKVTEGILTMLLVQIRTHMATNKVSLTKVSTTYRKTIPTWRKTIKTLLRIGDVVEAIYNNNKNISPEDFEKTKKSLTESISDLSQSLSSNETSRVALNEVYLASKELQKHLTE